MALKRWQGSRASRPLAILLGCGVLSLAFGVLLRYVAESVDRNPTGANETPAPQPMMPIPTKNATNTITDAASGTNRLWKARWLVPASTPRTYAFAQNGKAIAGVDAQGIVTALQPTDGTVLWTTPPLARVNRLLATTTAPR